MGSHMAASEWDFEKVGLSLSENERKIVLKRLSASMRFNY